jgi:hypothetical protein
VGVASLEHASDRPIATANAAEKVPLPDEFQAEKNARIDVSNTIVWESFK